jgi:hypothetical protein
MVLWIVLAENVQHREIKAPVSDLTLESESHET